MRPKETGHRALSSRSDVRARERRVAGKKKARRRGDVPSNKRYGNCLLGFHCSQKAQPGNRTSIGFPAVAGCQQGFLTTAYPQTPVDRLWIKSGCCRRASIPPSDTAFSGASSIDFSCPHEQSPRLPHKLAGANFDRHRKTRAAAAAHLPHRGKPELSAQVCAASTGGLQQHESDQIVPANDEVDDPALVGLGDLGLEGLD